MEFSRQEYWSRLSFLLQGIFLAQNWTSIFCVSCIGRCFLYHWASWGSIRSIAKFACCWLVWADTCEVHYHDTALFQISSKGKMLSSAKPSFYYQLIPLGYFLFFFPSSASFFYFFNSSALKNDWWLSWKSTFNYISWFLILYLSFGMVPLKINLWLWSYLAQLGFPNTWAAVTDSPIRLVTKIF